jgi:hypothetical protein
MPRLILAIPGALAGAVVAVASLAGPRLASAATPSPGPTLAREDTMHTSVPEVLVRAPRVTLDEILERIARGERRRDSLLVDQSFVATMRVMHARDDHSPAQLLEETVSQVYRRKPDKARTLLLRRTREKPEKKGSHEVQVSFRADMSEEIVNFAFRPEARRQFRYHIAGRDVIGNHVVYRIRFEPKSLLDPTAPSGLVWVDTNDFVIVRQELEFDRSPIPLILKNVDRMVIERERVGDFWVLHRVLMRAHFTLPMPRIGRRMDFSLLFDQYALNTGLPDSVFTSAGRP